MSRFLSLSSRFAVVSLALAFGAGAYAQSGSKTVSVSNGGGYSLQYSYSTTLSNESCNGAPHQIETTYTSFYFAGVSLSGQAELYQCNTEYTPVPNSWVLPSNAAYGAGCTLEVNPEENDEVYATLVNCPQ